MRRIFTLQLLSVALFAGSSFAQEKSVNPDINKSFQQPDVSTFIERFESEGREVYDHREEIVEACQLKPGLVVADIGAGTGLFTRIIAPRVTERGQVIAVDIAKEFVDHVVKTCTEEGIKNVKGIVCTADSAELPKDSVDLAFICDAYHHFEFPYKTMRSIHRGLKAGGQVVLVDFDRVEGKSSEWILNHLRAGKATFVKEIELAGFEVVEEQDFLATSYWIRFKKSDRKTDSNHTADSVDDVKRLLADGTAKLIDVREEEEWNAGHLAAAEFVPLSMLSSLPADQLQAKLADELPKDKIIYCHCRSGSRVLAATPILEKLGYDIRPLAIGYAALVEEGFKKAE